jgi:hypothetical protein
MPLASRRRYRVRGSPPRIPCRAHRLARADPRVRVLTNPLPPCLVAQGFAKGRSTHDRPVALDRLDRMRGLERIDADPAQHPSLAPSNSTSSVFQSITLVAMGGSPTGSGPLGTRCSCGADRGVGTSGYCHLMVVMSTLGVEMDGSDGAGGEHGRKRRQDDTATRCIERPAAPSSADLVCPLASAMTSSSRRNGLLRLRGDLSPSSTARPRRPGSGDA